MYIIYHISNTKIKINFMKKKTDFYLLKKKSLSEGDLFITDYIKTKQRLKKLTNELDILKLRVDNLNNNKKKVIKLYEDE